MGKDDSDGYGQFLPGGQYLLGSNPPRKWVNAHCTDPEPCGEELYAEITNSCAEPFAFTNC